MRWSSTLSVCSATRHSAGGVVTGDVEATVVVVGAFGAPVQVHAVAVDLEPRLALAFLSINNRGDLDGFAGYAVADWPLSRYLPSRLPAKPAHRKHLAAQVRRLWLCWALRLGCVRLD